MVINISVNPWGSLLQYYCNKNSRRFIQLWAARTAPRAGSGRQGASLCAKAGEGHGAMGKAPARECR